jgi:hypothetical protein
MPPWFRRPSADELKVGLDLMAIGISVYALVAALGSRTAADGANRIAQQALDAQLAPARITAIVGDPVWALSKPEAKKTVPAGRSRQDLEDDRTTGFSLIAPITFRNAGMQQGCVSDIVGEVTIPVTLDKHRLRASYFVNPEKMLASMRSATPLFDAHRAPFAPVVVPGQQVVSETVLLYAHEVGARDLQSGEYSLTVSLALCDNPSEWIVQHSEKYLITADDVPELVAFVPNIFESQSRRAASLAAAQARKP